MEYHEQTTGILFLRRIRRMAHITKKTIRYYDEHNILKPSLVNDKGARFLYG